MWTPDVSMEIPGFMEPEELQWLHDQAQRFERVLEIGTWLGRSTSALAVDCPGIVWTVDHFQGSPSERGSAHAEAAFGDLFARAQNYNVYDNVRWLHMQSRSAARLFSKHTLDMVFIDGDHEPFSVLSDLLLWDPRCRKLLCGHDRDYPGVQEALVTYGLPYQQGPGSIWYIERILDA